MIFPSWSRLVRLYSDRIQRLLLGQFGRALQDPSLVNDPKFQQAAWRVARDMVRQVAHVNASSWRAAAMKGSRAREIHQALQAEIRTHGFQAVLDQIALENAKLISSVPRKLAEQISPKAAEMAQQGVRPEAIAKWIRSALPTLIESRVQLIARTEISKSETQLSVMRAENIGIHWGVWETSKDQRVRQSHRNLQGVLVSSDDPPQPEQLIGEKSTLNHGLPGTFPNCRCVYLPLVSLDEVRWPARVYRSGSITRMSRAAFVRLVPAYRKAA